MKLQFRPAQANDLPEICALIRAATDAMARQGIFQWDEIYPTEADFRRDIHEGWLYVGWMEERIAVVFALNRECDAEYANGQWRHGDAYLVLHRLCVHPAFQRRGAGRQAMAHIEAQAAAMGARSLRLDVFSQNPFALRLYAGLGYEQTGCADWRKGRFYLMEKALPPHTNTP